MPNKDMQPDLFSYTDYRQLLKALFKYHKQRNKNFTYRYFSLKAGYSSPAMLKDVMEGRRNLPVKSIVRFISPFKLSSREADYFKVLVYFNLAKNSSDRRQYFRELIKLQRKPPSREITRKEYAFYKKWYFGAIREMVGLKGFKENPAWIAKTICPPITPAQAQEAVALLLKLGFVNRDKNGKLKQAVPKLTIDPQVRITAVKDLTRQLIELEWEALEKFGPHQRERLGLTMHMSLSCYEDIKKMVRKYQEEILDYVTRHPEKSELVCHLGLSLFPLVNSGETQRNK